MSAAPIVIPWVNITELEVPAGAVLEPAGGFDALGRMRMQISSRDANMNVWFNSPMPVTYGSPGDPDEVKPGGYCHAAWPMAAAAIHPDDAVESAAATFGLPCGTRAGDWFLRLSSRGFRWVGRDLHGMAQIVADPSADRVRTLRVTGADEDYPGLFPALLFPYQGYVAGANTWADSDEEVWAIAGPTGSPLTEGVYPNCAWVGGTWGGLPIYQASGSAPAEQQVGNTDTPATGDLPELDNFIGFQVVNDYLEYVLPAEGEVLKKPTINWKGFFVSSAITPIPESPVTSPKLIRKLSVFPPLYIDEPEIPLEDLETHMLRIKPDEISFPYSEIEYLKCVWLNYSVRSAFVTIEGIDYPVTFQEPGSGATFSTIKYATGIAGRSYTAQVVQDGEPVAGDCGILPPCCAGWYCVDGVVVEVLEGENVPTGTIVLGPYATEAEADVACTPCPECTPCSGIEELGIGTNSFEFALAEVLPFVRNYKYGPVLWTLCLPEGSCDYTVNAENFVLSGFGDSIVDPDESYLLLGLYSEGEPCTPAPEPSTDPIADADNDLINLADFASDGAPIDGVDIGAMTRATSTGSACRKVFVFFYASWENVTPGLTPTITFDINVVPCF